MPEPGQNEPVLSVSDVNEQVNELLNDNIPPIWIEGEISGFTAHRSGHWYFTVKDERAELSCTMFKSSNRHLTEKFQNGNQVLLKCKLSIYQARGQFQGLVTYMEQAGEGKLRREFEQLREKLQKEGLFDEALKTSIPRYPKSIAIVSSPEGAAIRDMYTNIQRRYPIVRVVLIPAAMQGASAPSSIVDAFTRVSRLIPQPDTVIVTRGGGSLEDLAAFNNEKVALAIVDCSVPVISAIGHETDFTIADFVSDRRAPTPSTAAEIATPDKSELQTTLDLNADLLLERLRRRVNTAQQTLEATQARLSSPKSTMNRQAERLDFLEKQLPAYAHRKFDTHNLQFKRVQDLLVRANPKRLIKDHENAVQTLERHLVDPRKQLSELNDKVRELRRALASFIRNIIRTQLTNITHIKQRVHQTNPLRRIEDMSKVLTQTQKSLNQLVVQQISRSNQSVGQIARTLHAVSPLATLDRGFAVVSKPNDSEWGELVTEPTQVKKGDLIRARTATGEIDSVVTQTRSRSR